MRVAVIILMILLGTSTAFAQNILREKVVQYVKNYDPAIPNPLTYMHFPTIPAYALGYPLCVMSTAFIKIARSKRALTERENLKIFVGCVIPFGGLIVDEIADRGKKDTHPHKSLACHKYELCGRRKRA